MDEREFILRHTRPQSPPLVPEIELLLADDIMQLWSAVSDELSIENPSIPFWASAWVGGQAVARYVLDHPECVAGKRVLDVATGSALCALAAAQACATSVLASDTDAMACIAAAENLARNVAPVTILEGNLLHSDPPEVDVILAGDVCYERDMAREFLRWLRLADERGICVILGDPGRHYFPRAEMDLLQTYDVPTTWEVEGTERKSTGVYTFKKST